MAPATSASAGGGLTDAVIGPQAERVANVTLRPWWERIQNRPRIAIAELSMSFMTEVVALTPFSERTASSAG